jgi:cleavage and polyadenylation specificity factor subunit 3
MQVDAISFSAHADFSQTSEFLDALQPPHVILVHGEKGEMFRLAKALEQHAAALGMTRAVYTPGNTQPVLVAHHARRMARAAGRLASKAPAPGAALRGLLVEQGGGGGVGAGRALLLHHDDLPRFTRLHPGTVVQRQAVALQRPFGEVRLALEVMFEGVQGTGDLGSVVGSGSVVDGEGEGEGEGEGGMSGSPSAGQQALRVGDAVTLTHRPARGDVVLEWVGGAEADMVADAAVAVVLQAAGAPPALAAIEEERQAAEAAGDAEALARTGTGILATLLGAQFGPACADLEQGLVFVEVDGCQVVVDAKSGGVQCGEAALRERVDKAVGRVLEAMQPCMLSSAGGDAGGF